MARKTLADLRPGDDIVVHDTSNERDLVGNFMRHDQGSMYVWVTRFGSPMKFNDEGLTPMGRFKLRLP